MRWLLLTIVVVSLSGAHVVAADRPNVLLICVDDLKPILGCYGDRRVKSPNIDRLAQRSLRFDRAYCNQAVCAPSRNAMLTGRRPTSLGIYDLGTNFRKAAPDAVTLPQHFKQHGYRCEALGKIFHVGHGNHEDPASWSVKHFSVPVVAYASGQNDGEPTREEALFSNVPGEQVGRLRRGPAHEAADVDDAGYPDGRLAEEAIKRLKSAADRPNEPFFMAVGFVKPHLPFCAPQKYWKLYEPSDFEVPADQTPPEGAPKFAPTTWGELRQYAGIPDRGPLDAETQRTLIQGYHAAISYMDAQVGRVLEALDTTGLADNTIVVLWGDHGWHLGDHGMWCKHSNYEQATRIPLLVSVPGSESRGKTSSALAESVDIYPTLCELAGLTAPGNLDGRSFARSLDDPAAPTKDAIYHVYPRGDRLGRTVRTERYRLVEWKRPGAPSDESIYELYDYDEAPSEPRNLASERPEVVADLAKLLAAQGEAKPPWKASSAP